MGWFICICFARTSWYISLHIHCAYLGKSLLPMQHQNRGHHTCLGVTLRYMGLSFPCRVTPILSHPFLMIGNTRLLGSWWLLTWLCDPCFPRHELGAQDRLNLWNDLAWKTLYHGVSILVYGTRATVLKGHSRINFLKVHMLITWPFPPAARGVRRARCRGQWCCWRWKPTLWESPPPPPAAVLTPPCLPRLQTPASHRIQHPLFTPLSHTPPLQRSPPQLLRQRPERLLLRTYHGGPSSCHRRVRSWVLDPRHCSLGWFRGTTKRFPGIAQEIHLMNRFQQNHWSFTLSCDNAPWRLLVA